VSHHPQSVGRSVDLSISQINKKSTNQSVDHQPPHAQTETQKPSPPPPKKKQMETLSLGTEQDFKNYIDLPLARIKRIMKSDEDVHMISAEVLVLFAKACEMFILELTIRCVRALRLFFFFFF
jgi:hypothetical protein